MDLENLSSSSLGLNGLKALIAKHQLTTAEIEKDWIANNEYDRLFLHNLVYPYGIARKYYMHWIPKEALIDESINGFRKALKKYLEQEREFRIGSYAVWWCQKYCIDEIFHHIREVKKKYEEKNIPKESLEKIIVKIKFGKTGQAEFLEEHYSYLFEEMDQKYEDTAVALSKKSREEATFKAINRDFSMEVLQDDFYDNLKAQMTFEEILLLEYSLRYEKEIKA